MKLFTVIPAVALLAGAASAKAVLAVFEDEVRIGKTYKVEWLQNTAQEHLTLDLVKKDPTGWKQVEQLFKHQVGDSPGGHFEWTVSDSITPGKGYGLWLSSTPIPAKDGKGYADLTSWFEIEAPKGDKRAVEFEA